MGMVKEPGDQEVQGEGDAQALNFCPSQGFSLA